ncbi:aspartic proteinase CDR1 [Quercus suber]|uniref:aspartic proteinase CDR1 n=1 Tax=Quercus suber TaxID=58331 RepID=UPI0032DEA407
MNFANVINSTKQGIKVLRPMVHNFGSFYVANIEFGTPPYSELLAVDTGSDETWNMSREQNKCIFDRRYFDGSHTTGYLSGETFKFPTSEGACETYENLIFGVGLFNENIQFSRYMGESNKVAGIFGLGPGERSILKQLKDDTDLRFSYCLSDWIIEQNPFTYLHFGSDAQISGNGQATVQRTPLIPGQNHYNVEVLSIWLDGRKLRIDPAELQVRVDSSGGFIIDSGTTITLLVPNAYNTIRNAIVRYLRAYNWSPMANTGMMYDLCYNVQPTEYQQFPPLAIKFLGAKLEIGSHKLFKSVYENVYCLTIIPTSKHKG